MSDTCPHTPRDFLSRRVAPWLLWGLPAACIMVSAWLEMVPIVRMTVWILSLLVMGVACVLNAARCGRLHCHLTGPFFLLLALAVFLHGANIVPLGPDGWSGLIIIFLTGAVILIFVPEWIWGKYRRGT